MEKAAVLMAILALLCKILGFLKESAMAYFFGNSYIVDAYSMTDSIVFVLCGWLVALATVYIPRYILIRDKSGEKQAEEYTNKVLTISVVVSFLVAIVCAIFKDVVIAVFARSASDEMLFVLKAFFGVAIFAMPFLAVYRVLRGYFDSNSHFVIGAVVDLGISIIMFAIILTAGLYNSNIIRWVIPCGYFFAAIVFLVLLKKDGHKLKIDFSVTQDIKYTFISLPPIFFNIMLIELTSLTDKFFAVTLPEGNVSSLHYASLVETLVVHVIGSTIITIIYPLLSKTILLPGKEEFHRVFVKGINTIFILLLPISVGVMILSQNVIMIMFQRGNFDVSDTIFTAKLLQIYVLGAAPYVIREIISRFLCAIQKNKVILIGGGITLILNILLDYCLIKIAGGVGLALATTLSIVLVVPFYFWSMREWLNKESLLNLGRVFLKTVMCCIIMGIGVYFSNLALNNIIESTNIVVQIIVLMINTIVGIGIYAVSAYIFRIQEVKEILVKLLMKGTIK